MKVVDEYPPNYKEICKRFKIKNREGIVFTYGDILYNPSGDRISPDLMAHEETHVKQQKIMGVRLWWDTYLINDYFRLEMEVEAYREQLRVAKQLYPRNIWRKVLRGISRDLAGPIYGDLVTVQAAKALIEGNLE